MLLKLSSDKSVESRFHLNDGDPILDDPKLIMSYYIFSQPSGAIGIVLNTRNRVSVGMLSKNGIIKAKSFRRDIFDKLNQSASFTRMLKKRWIKSIFFPFAVIMHTYLFYILFKVLTVDTIVSAASIQNITMLVVILGFCAIKGITDPVMLKLNGAANMLMNAICDIRYIQGDYRDLKMNDFPNIAERGLIDYITTTTESTYTISLLYAMLLVDGSTFIGMLIIFFLGLCAIPISLHTLYFYGNDFCRNLARGLVSPQWFYSNNPGVPELKLCLETYNHID